MRDAFLMAIVIFFALEGVVGLILGALILQDWRASKRADKRVVEEIIRMYREGK